MELPFEFRSRLKECVLALFWRKTDINRFLIENGVSPAFLANHDIRELRRVEIVERAFSFLESKPDHGLGEFRKIAQTLESWTDFDSYWFREGKLSKGQAKLLIENLGHAIKASQQAKKEADSRRRKQSLDSKKKSKRDALTKEFYALLSGSGMTPQQRGYRFEKLLKALFDFEGLEATASYRVSSEQIDGSLKFEGEHYILEAKWHQVSIGNEGLYQMAHKVDGKFYGRGLYISFNGYSPDAVRALRIGKVQKMILFDGADITRILEGYLTFTHTLNRKVKAAQTRGEIYADPETLKAKLPQAKAK